jgi:hypothetical protein
VQPGAEIAEQSATGQGHRGKTPSLGSPIQLPAGISGQEQAMAALLHDLGFRQDAPFLAAPAEGGFGVQDSILPRWQPSGHQ